MTSRSVAIIAPNVAAPSQDAEVWVDGPTNSLLVKVVNPAAGGGGVQYTEDSVHASGDTGTLALVVRKDAAGSLVSADGDYAPLQVDASGALRVTGGGGGTQFAEDSAHVSGDVGTLSLVVRQDTPGALAGTDGDYAPLQVDATGRLRVTVDASVALVVGDGGGSLTVDGTVNVGNFPAVQPVNDNGGSLTVDGTVAVSGTVAVTQSGAWTVETGLGKAEDAIHASGDVGVMSLAVRADTAAATAANGDYHPLLVDATGRLHVQAGVVPVTDNGGSLTVDGTVAATQSGAWTVSAIQNGNWEVDVLNIVPGTGALELGKAEDAIHATGDVGVMALAVRADTAAASAADGDYHPLLVDSTGKLHVNVGNATLAVTQSGTWNIGTVSTVSAITPGTGATNLGKAEDAGHTTGDVGVMALAVRKDAPGTLAGTDGDYAPIQVTAGGAVRVSADVTNVVSVTANVVDPNTGLSFGVYNGAGAAPNLGDRYGNSPMFECITANSWPTLSDNTWSTGYVDTSTGALFVYAVNTVATSVQSVLPGTGALNLGKAEDTGHTTGDVGVMTLAVRQDAEGSLSGTTGDYTPFQVDSLGRLRTAKCGGKVTYRGATTTTFAAAAGAAMFFVIAGSSTKTIVVQRIRISCMTLTAVAYNSIVVEKWSTAPTGGTATTLTKVPNDANDAAATANLCQVYTAAPTEGTLVGTVGCVRSLFQATTAAAAGFPPDIEWDFRNRGENKGEYLRGTAQCLSLAFGAAPASAVTMCLEVEWTEE